MSDNKQTLGILGLGGFGSIVAKHLAPHFDVAAFDPSQTTPDRAASLGIGYGTLPQIAARDIVVLAMPIPRMQEAIAAIKPHVKPGALVLDVGSVKIKPVQWMRAGLPEHVDIVATHPLFGPQSAPVSIKGQNIAVCPVRGERADCVEAFLRDVLELNVMRTTPEEHDYEVAHIQGLTHMVGRILDEMEPLPRRMTTKSFDLLMESVDIVRGNSLELFLSIEKENPFSADVHRKLFQKVEELRTFLRTYDAWESEGK